ncbi:MAG: hypothetical protein RL557_952 [archaeon]|jgi:hypothetical protein
MTNKEYRRSIGKLEKSLGILAVSVVSYLAGHYGPEIGLDYEPAKEFLTNLGKLGMVGGGALSIAYGIGSYLKR